METRRLQVLLELSRLGSMREVAEVLNTSTSTVSQQIAMLARETGVALIEPSGRRVRLTPAGRRLADHAATILGAVEAAKVDLDPDAEPAGTLRVCGFATAIRLALLPVVADLAVSHPMVHVNVSEHEPAEAFALLGSDDIDLALTYDYNLAPAAVDPMFDNVALWSTNWSLGVRVEDAQPPGLDRANAAQLFGTFRDHAWIGNSRNDADAEVVRLIGSMAGFEPRMAHLSDSLDLVEDLILAGMGVGMLPSDRPVRPGIAHLRLRDPEVQLRAYATSRRGRTSWPPLALLLSKVVG